MADLREMKLEAGVSEMEAGRLKAGIPAQFAVQAHSIAQVSYENGVITSAELSDAQVRLLQTEWLLMQAKYSRIVAAAKARAAAGVGGNVATAAQRTQR